ncbi:MAG: glycoside hydrolase family 2 TIM barrel-domain containing protein [Bacteroidales bacterium]
MKTILSLFLVLFFFNFRVISQTLLFDNDWKFYRGGAQGAENPEFNDNLWKNIDLPHDWSIENLPGSDSPFSVNAISQVSGGFTTGGTGWYRKKFNLPAEGKTVILQFDGVYMNAEVWLNGQYLGNHPYGYTSFWFDISEKLKPGQENVLAVKVKNEGENSRWYSGSGIYRHVWLKIVNPVHFAQWGTIVTTELSEKSAKVNIHTKIENQSGKDGKIKLVTTILSPDATEISKSVAESGILKNQTGEFNSEIIINSPKIWDIESPSLYLSVCEVYMDDNLVDKQENKFGIRSVQFDINKGFILNGKPLKLKGGCFHHDHGPLGSKSYDRAEERRVELLKASGFNAIRCSHNPPAPAFLDACDKLGMLVIDEAFDMWQYPKNQNDYHLYFKDWWQKDIESMVMRDKNHPCIILWSIGNEIPGMDNPDVVETAKMLAAFVKKLDPSRLVIAAVNNLNPKKDPYFSALDIAGYNYGSGGDHLKESIFDLDHQRVPQRIMVQTESYPLEAFQSWMDVLEHNWLIGDFVWTAFDYIGEASIGWRGYMQEQNFYPWNLAYCGDIDICGWKRPQSYYRDALWKPNQLSVFVQPTKPSFDENPNRQFWSKWHWFDDVADWNWKGYENQSFKVKAYSSCEQAELFLNGKSLGKQKTDRSTKFTAQWEVPYQPGELKVVGYQGKKIVNTTNLKTADGPTLLKISADKLKIKANNQDLSYITIELTDNKGIVNPKAENLLEFEISGPGNIVGVGNANPLSTESFQGNKRNAWHGKCLLIVKSTNEPGLITVKVSTPGFKSQNLSIESVH